MADSAVGAAPPLGDPRAEVGPGPLAPVSYREVEVSSPSGRARAVRGIYMSTVLISIWCGYIVVMTSIDEYVDVKIVLKEEEENSYTCRQT